MTIPLDTAQTIVRETLAKGRALDLKPLAVIVLDAGGHMIAFAREDGTSPGRGPVAQGKAHAAVMMGMAGTALTALSQERPFFSAALVGTFGGQFVPVPGGVLVRDAAGRVLGAVGVSGDTSDNDAAAAVAGIEAAGLSAEI